MPRVTIAESPTFDTDDKRAQYARLAVWNHGLVQKMYPRTVSVTAVTETNLTLAWNNLVLGNYLEGPAGIENIMRLTKNGAEDTKVQSRGLTKAYAQEVRPFIRKGLLSPTFGRRRKTPVSTEVQDVQQEKVIPTKTSARKSRAKKNEAI